MLNSTCRLYPCFSLLFNSFTLYTVYSFADFKSVSICLRWRFCCFLVVIPELALQECCGEWLSPPFRSGWHPLKTYTMHGLALETTSCCHLITFSTFLQVLECKILLDVNVINSGDKTFIPYCPTACPDAVPVSCCGQHLVYNQHTHSCSHAVDVSKTTAFLKTVGRVTQFTRALNLRRLKLVFMQLPISICKYWLPFQTTYCKLAGSDDIVRKWFSRSACIVIRKSASF